MGNIFSNKSFMNRYFSAPKSTGPAKLTDLSGDGKVTQKDVLIGKGVLDAPKQPAKMQEQEGPAKKKADGTKMTKGEKQADRASKKSTRKKKRAEKRIDRNEKKQDRISKNTSKSTDPEVVKSGQARIERAKKRVEKNKTVSPDYVSKKDKANIAKDEKNKPGLKNPPPSSKQETPLSAADKGDDFDKFLSPAKKTKRKGLLRRANKEIARKNTDSKKVQRLVEKYVEKNK